MVRLSQLSALRLLPMEHYPRVLIVDDVPNVGITQRTLDLRWTK
jgi:hypothetical protein